MCDVAKHCKLDEKNGALPNVKCPNNNGGAETFAQGYLPPKMSAPGHKFAEIEELAPNAIKYCGKETVCNINEYVVSESQLMTMVFLVNLDATIFQMRNIELYQ